tara:strand:- start:34 stop:354 length:321 start_codon:yes stop_codon:yes gene_type:complete
MVQKLQAKAGRVIFRPTEKINQTKTDSDTERTSARLNWKLLLPKAVTITTMIVVGINPMRVINKAKIPTAAVTATKGLNVKGGGLSRWVVLRNESSAITAPNAVSM